MNENLFTLYNIFLVSAVAGGTFFLIQFLFQLIGLGGHSDVSHFPGDSGAISSDGVGDMSGLSTDGGNFPDNSVGHDFHGAGADHSAEAPSHGGDLSDSDLSFRYLSLQGISIFLMIFGLAGLASTSQSFFPRWFSVPVSLALGGAVVWAVAKIYRKIFALQSSGNISIHSALGEEGVVYLTIPPGETGKVQLTVQDRLRIYDAVSRETTPVATGTRVRVLDIINDNTILVKPVQEIFS